METPYEEFKRRRAANDSLIRGASLENGRLIAHERTLIYGSSAESVGDLEWNRV